MMRGTEYVQEDPVRAPAPTANASPLTANPSHCRSQRGMYPGCPACTLTHACTGFGRRQGLEDGGKAQRDLRLRVWIVCRV